MEHIEKYPLEKPMEDSQLYHPIISITFFNREDDVAAGRKCSKNRSQVASAICVAVWNSTFLASSVWRGLNQVWLDASCMLVTQELMFLHTSSVPFNFSNTVDDRRLRTQNCISWDEKGSCFCRAYSTWPSQIVRSLPGQKFLFTIVFQGCWWKQLLANGKKNNYQAKTWASVSGWEWQVWKIWFLSAIICLSLNSRAT